MLTSLFELSREFIKLKNQKFRRYFMSQENALTERLSILLGQRGIGKTTMIIQHLLDCADGDPLSDKILYIQADHFIMNQSSLYEVAKDFKLMGGKFLALDEIHKYDNWSMELKSITDSYPDLKIIASGSSALEIHRGSHDLSRRALVYHILGMSFREYLALNCDLHFSAYSLEEILTNHVEIADTIVTQIKQKNEAVIPLFQRYLQFGYYPYYNEFNDSAKFKMTLEQNIHTTLESDLRAIYPQLTSHSIKKIRQLLSYIALNAPFSPNWSNLKKFLELGDERTLKNYLKYLEDAGLVVAVYKSSKILSKLDTPAKIYLQNSNLMQAIANEKMNIGTAREIFFYNMLMKNHELSVPINGDFLVDDNAVFEIGGRKKSFNQIKDHQHAYIASDNIEAGFQNKIPLWLFGFLY